MHRNVVPKIFHTQHICHHAWKTVGITPKCFVVLQLRGEGPETRKTLGQIGPIFVLLLSVIGEQQYISK